MEAYGLIGVFSLLQLTLNLLDSAISPAINRQMSRYTGNDCSLESIRNYLRTTEIIIIPISLLFSLIIYLTSNFIAEKWLNVENLPISTVVEAVSIGGFVVASRFMEGLYRSVLVGLQKMVGMNIINIVTNTFRNIGVIFVLKYYSPTIQVFFKWQGLLSIITVLTLIIYVYKQLPGMLSKAKFSQNEIKNNWKYLSDSLGNSLLAFICLQSDKILTSKLLSLTDFANYSLSATIVQTIPLILMPVTQAIYPNIVKLYSEKNDDGASDFFHKGCQLMAILSGTASFSLIFFGNVIIGFWTHDQSLTENILPVINRLSLGVLCNSFLYFPYYLPYIVGKPKVNHKANIFALVFLFTVTIPLTLHYGILGAANANMLQNLALLMFFPLYFNCYLKQETNYWLKSDIFLPMITLLSIFFIEKLILSNLLRINLESFIATFIIAGISLAISAFVCKNLKTSLIKIYKNKIDLPTSRI